MNTRLDGIIWSHSHGYTSITAVSQCFCELHPDVSIHWRKRSLQELVDAPIKNLAKPYDLFMIDRPWASFAATTGILFPLEKYLSKECLGDQLASSVGASHLSYNLNGFQNALATGVATPIAVCRPDHFRNGERPLPADFKDVVDLARRGHVAFVDIPLNLLMDLYMRCVTSIEHSFDDPDGIVETGLEISILKDMHRPASYCSESIFQRDLTQIHEALVEDNDLCYCPYAYGYISYSRRGYCSHPLKAMDLVAYRGKMLCSVLGGTGLAMSSLCENREAALRFAEYTASPLVQIVLYTENGRQPDHRKVRLDEVNSSMTMNFFKDILDTLDRSYLRPRHNDYLYFQDHTRGCIQGYIMGGGSPAHVLDQLNRLYRKPKEESK